MTTTQAPWRCVDDRSIQDEPHFQVVNAAGASLFDSINRSPAADASTERGDMQLAAAAPVMLAALQVVAEKLGSRPYGTGSYLPKPIRDQVFAAIAVATDAKGGTA